MIRVLLALSFVFVVACKREKPEDISFDARESLPGFSVGLPEGERIKSDTTPVAGQLLIRRGNLVVTVGWQAGKMAKEELPMMAAGVQGAIGTVGNGEIEKTDLVLAGSSYGTEFLLPTDKQVYLAMGVVQCMESNVTVTLAVMGVPDRDAARALLQRWVSTLQCGDAKSALTTDGGIPPFAMDESMGYLPGSDPPTFVSLVGSRWYVTPGVPGMRAAFEKPAAVAAMMSGLGVTVTEQTVLPPPPGWLVVQLKVAIDGDAGAMLLGVLTCGEAAYSVVHISGDLAIPDPKELERLKCGDPVDATTLPTVSDRFGRACDDGNAQACATLAMLVDEEPKLLAGHDAAKLRARACELGLAAACG